MADRDKYGNYVNDKGVTIKINTDKNGNDHISFYGGEVDKPHDAAHVNVNYDKGSWSSTTHGPDKSDTSSGSGGCYLTSACMKYFQEKFDDNCYELTVLRWFRDNFVSKEDIEHYYEVAPIIVEAINKEDPPKMILLGEGAADLGIKILREEIREITKWKDLGEAVGFEKQ